MDPNALCPNCETAYTFDSRHCYICDKCIGKFDHHCQWINNCVGRGNHKVFYVYILTLLIYFIVQIFFTIKSLISDQDFFEVGTYNVLGLPAEKFKKHSLIYDYTSVVPPMISDEAREFWFMLTLIEVLLISFLFAIPLSYLVAIQTKNVLANTTTYMRFSKRANM